MTMVEAAGEEAAAAADMEVGRLGAGAEVGAAAEAMGAAAAVGMGEAVATAGVIEAAATVTGGVTEAAVAAMVVEEEVPATAVVKRAILRAIVQPLKAEAEAEVEAAGEEVATVGVATVEEDMGVVDGEDMEVGDEVEAAAAAMLATPAANQVTSPAIALKRRPTHHVFLHIIVFRDGCIAFCTETR